MYFSGPDGELRGRQDLRQRRGEQRQQGHLHGVRQGRQAGQPQ